MARIRTLLFAATVAAASPLQGAAPAAAAEPVMVQCGRDYQAAKAAGTLNGMDWNRYRADCAERLKGSPATTAAPPVSAASAPAPAAQPAATPATPSGGMAAMRLRQRQCGAEWTAQKATLVVQTPGLTWPRYWSQCNTRLKATGR